MKIICTQPRRMAVTNISQRLASELGEPLGLTVGYQIGMENVMSAQNRILYMTNGLLVQKIVHDRTFFKQTTHIILDEVHERDLDSDFIMIALKKIM